MKNTIDILHAFSIAPPELDFVWPGFLAGTVGALVAPGSSGKSYWALQAAMSVATGGRADLLGLSVPDRDDSRVWYVCLEDPAGVIQRRLHAMGAHLDMHQRQAVADNLTISALCGLSLDIMNEQHRKTLTEEAKGHRLVIIDTLSRAHRLDENSNGDMAQLVAALEGICRESGAAVLVVHHVSKAAALAGQGGLQQAARGASALVDNMRWVGTLQTMTEEESKENMASPAAGSAIDAERTRYVRFSTAKQNYGQIQPEQWYRRGEGGVLHAAEVFPLRQRKGRSADV